MPLPLLIVVEGDSVLERTRSLHQPLCHRVIDRPLAHIGLRQRCSPIRHHSSLPPAPRPASQATAFTPLVERSPAERSCCGRPPSRPTRRTHPRIRGRLNLRTLTRLSCSGGSHMAPAPSPKEGLASCAARLMLRLWVIGSGALAGRSGGSLFFSDDAATPQQPDTPPGTDRVPGLARRHGHKARGRERNRGLLARLLRAG